MIPFEIDGKCYHLNQRKQALPVFDLIHWLDSQPIYPKVFWREKGSPIARAAVGNLLSFAHVPNFSASASMDIRLYGGIRFAPNVYDDATWRGFPNASFWLPEIEVSQEEAHTELIYNDLLNSCARGDFKDQKSCVNPETWGKIDALSEGLSHPTLEHKETPDFEGWNQRVSAVLEEIASGRISKLILARKTSYQFLRQVSIWPLFRCLMEKARSATLFAFQLTPTLCFLGATPEKLFQREGNVLSADAIAGTRARGRTLDEDVQLEQELLVSPKEQLEFAIVKRFLQETLVALSDGLKWDGDDRILKASHVQHIHNTLNAVLKKKILDAELISALHPTPALGGFPRDSALNFLKKIEPFDRGWYGAPVGMISPHRSCFYVAIRSALIRERSLHLFAGTGLVQGSVAAREWDELEQKIRPFTETLSGPKCI